VQYHGPEGLKRTFRPDGGYAGRLTLRRPWRDAELNWERILDAAVSRCCGGAMSPAIAARPGPRFQHTDRGSLPPRAWRGLATSWL
jgi:hypothetical protein